MEKLPANLIVLMYSRQNSCYPEITDESVPGLTIITRNDTADGWSFKNPTDLIKSPSVIRNIGEHDYFMRDNRSGVIGVYDLTKMHHLEAMVRSWQEMSEAKNDWGSSSYD